MRKIVFWLALLFSVPASAGVVYNWQTLTQDSTVPALNGRVEISDLAWRSGALSHTYLPTCGPWHWEPDCDYTTIDMSDPDSPVLSVSFGGGLSDDGYRIEIDYLAGTGLRDYGGYGTYFDFAFGALLDGEFYASSAHTAVQMSSANGVWTIGSYNSDDGYPCGPGWGADPPSYGSPCAGVMGLWVLDLSTIPVPLPGSVPLVALGLAAFILAGRRVRVA